MENRSATMGHNQSQYSLRDCLLLTAAIAVWIWFLTQQSALRGAGLGIMSVIALAAGMAGHWVYRFLLPWPVVVVITSLLLYSLVALLIFALGGSLDGVSAILFLLETVVAPARQLVATDRFLNWTPLLSGILTALMLAPAYWIRPRLPWAVVTALGVAAWYMTGLSVSISRYFGA